ncbi:SagB/ThcOx family dehydrogenase [Haloarchaeobius amylolyticus]|uniref:SagB/ThcOx family dehydrogenase n=1 Tax=Haloarchaeobius amylolyticus TaxID=1198296 RepID=UPI002271EC70|nr:SagB/ThcOx family dehydrogenase [Haloarchaeobius amylolyticus]
MVDAREYHERSKHSPQSVRDTDWTLDFDNKPRPSKVYTDLPRLSLGEPVNPPDAPALSAVATSRPSPDRVGDPATGTGLAELCHYAAGVTKTLEIRGEQASFRAASCTGKLYHIDLYAVTGDLDDADPGVYQYDPESDEFHVLREGDFRGVLAAASGGQQGVADAPVTLVATSTWWRNSWKYRDRTYRHAFWDSGTVLANLLAVAHGAGYRAEVVAGFADEPVVELLGIDPEWEAPLELVAVGADDPAPAPGSVEHIDPAIEVASDPVEFPLIHDAWDQSTLADGETAEAWREGFADATAADCGTHAPGAGDLVQLDPVDDETASARPVGNTIERRGSLREYSHEPISDRKLATILDRALRGVPTDCFGRGAPDSLLDYYVLVHAVEGVPSGAYQYHPGENALERVGDTGRQEAAYLALGQEVVGDAAVNVYAMADVDAVVEHVGNRGYRLAQLEGGIALGRLYLATYAHRALGGRGFTFYDDLVSEHLSPRASNQTPMTLFAFGKPEQ